ncbi:MAG TPA: hypothetical protein VEI97_16485, partial [bacterium]|nr:hypothetical protein [bacterium]
NYAEATAPFPIDLKAAPYNFGLGSVYVHDFDVSLYNQALYILAETSGGVERLYRIECDGSFTNPIPGTTNPNPVNFQAYTFNTLGRPCDLTIDQWTTAGALLGAASDVQIIVTGFDGDSVTGTGSHGQHIFTTRLQRTASSSSGSSIYRSTINVGTNHLCGRQGSLADPIRHMPPPAGWQ